MNPAIEPKTETISTAVSENVFSLIQTWCMEHDRTLSWFARDAILAKARSLGILPDRLA